MSHQAQRFSRAHLAQEANLRAQVPAGALTLVWRSKGSPRSTSIPYGIAASVGALAAALSIWGVAVTSYMAFKDDIVGGLMHRQVTMQHAYEERIQALRGQVDHLTSRHLVDQGELERRVEQMARRQALLETRQSIVTSLAEVANPREINGSRPPVRAGMTASPLPTETATARPAPAGDTLRLTPPPERQSRLESRLSPVQTADSTPQSGRMDRLERSLDRIDRNQQLALQALEARTERQTRRIKAVLSELGLEAVRPARTPPPSGVGGPLIPIVGPEATASAFERQVMRIQTVLQDHGRLSDLLGTIPLGRPHHGQLDISSGFGARLDPFMRSWAMHSGIDFRGTTGDPALASAAGKVTHAGSMGGYGLMVEIDHGNGLATRYAHLSRIEVREGETVRLGQRIGRVGTTGRSTGPHLHYETRIHGEAVDPMRFVRAGLRLATAD